MYKIYVFTFYRTDDQKLLRGKSSAFKQSTHEEVKLVILRNVTILNDYINMSN